MNLDAKLLSSHRTQLTLTALVSGVVVGSTILAFQRVNRLSKVKNLKDSIPKSSEPVAVCFSPCQLFDIVVKKVIPDTPSSSQTMALPPPPTKTAPSPPLPSAATGTKVPLLYPSPIPLPPYSHH